MTAPAMINGKKKVFEETFVSPFEKDTEDDAIRILDDIRASHDKASGWIEFSGHAIHLPNGKWKAIRHHAKYE